MPSTWMTSTLRPWTRCHRPASLTAPRTAGVLLRLAFKAGLSPRFPRRTGSRRFWGWRLNRFGGWGVLSAMSVEGPEALCDEIRHRLVGALTLATGDRGVGEELAQEALVRAWQRWPEVGSLDSPEAWTFRVGFNLAGSWRRRRSAERRAVRRNGHRVAHHDPDVAEVEAVRQAVAALPPRQREVVVARFYLGHDVAGTAALLGCAEGTVKAATSHALAGLRRAGLVDDRWNDLEEATP